MDKIIHQLKPLVEELYNKGFTIITCIYSSFKDDTVNYFYAFKDGDFAYIQYDFYNYGICTVNVPSGNHGTGTSVYSSWDKPTIDKVYTAMKLKHFSGINTQPVYYKTLQEFINSKSRSCEVKTFSIN